MHRNARQSGSALILLLVIVATLAILAVTLVVTLGNQQGATAGERQRKTTANYAEAALDNAITLAKSRTISTTSEWLTPADLASSFGSASFPAGATVVFKVYDNLNPVNYTIKWDQGSPTSATTPDGMVWIESTVTYLGKTSRMRCLVRETQASIVSSLPRAVLYSDTGILLSNTSDIYALDPNGQPHTSGPPYPTTVMAGGNIQGNSNSNLAAPSTTAQSIGGRYNGSLSGLPFTPNNFVQGGVGLLSDYFDQGAQADLGDEAQSGSPTQANASATVVSATTIQNNSTYGGVNGASATDVKVNGNLTLGSGTRYFRSLYVTGNLTQNAGGTFNCSALYVGGTLSITSSSAATFQLGPTYVVGNVTWDSNGSFPSNALTIKTTNWTNPTLPAGPFWTGANLSATGAYNITLGDTWISGNAGTGNIAIEFDGPSSGSYFSTVMCSLMATTEHTVTKYKVNFGTVNDPMTYYMQCDNDGLYSNTCEWGSSGTFYGLMVIMEAVIQVTGGDGTTPSIVGAIFCGTPYVSGTTPTTNDITLTGASTAAYNQAVIDKCVNVAITTTTTTLQSVPGSWQQLSPQ